MTGFKNRSVSFVSLEGKLPFSTNVERDNVHACDIAWAELSFTLGTVIPPSETGFSSTLLSFKETCHRGWGSKNYQTMKRGILLTTLIAIAFTFNSCSDYGSIDPVYGCTDPESVNYNPNANTDDGSCEYEGSVMFWVNENGAETIHVYMDNHYEGKITHFYSTYNPECGATGCLTVSNLDVGNHNYTATSTEGHEWNGSITITANQCKRILLRF